MLLPPAFKENENIVHAVIEAAKGSTIKYRYVHEGDYFAVQRFLPDGNFFPFDFGFIPQTLAEDGDEIDVAVLCDSPTFTGCIIECRCIGVLKIEQSEKGKPVYRNDRVIAVAAASNNLSDLCNVDDLNEHLLDEITGFFRKMSAFAGKSFELLGIEGADAAIEIIRKGMTKDDKAF